jgi:hypothetical protein
MDDDGLDVQSNASSIISVSTSRSTGTAVERLHNPIDIHRQDRTTASGILQRGRKGKAREHMRELLKKTMRIFDKEQLPDLKAKFMTNARFREQQVRRGYTVDCYFRCNVVFDGEIGKLVRRIDLNDFRPCCNHMAALYEADGMFNSDAVKDPRMPSDEVISAELRDYYDGSTATPQETNASIHASTTDLAASSGSTYKHSNYFCPMAGENDPAVKELLAETNKNTIKRRRQGLDPISETASQVPLQPNVEMVDLEGSDDDDTRSVTSSASTSVAQQRRHLQATSLRRKRQRRSASARPPLKLLRLLPPCASI